MKQGQGQVRLCLDSRLGKITISCCSKFIKGQIVQIMYNPKSSYKATTIKQDCDLLNLYNFYLIDKSTKTK